jgi:hypothetical protein
MHSHSTSKKQTPHNTLSSSVALMRLSHYLLPDTETWRKGVSRLLFSVFGFWKSNGSLGHFKLELGQFPFLKEKKDFILIPKI